MLLSQPYLFRDEIIKRDGTTFTGSEYFIGSDKRGADVKQSFVDMLRDNNEDKEPNCFYFAYIDTKTKTFKCWKNIEGYDAWEISIQ